MANEVVTQLRRSDVAQPATTLPTAVELVTGLRDTIAQMKPDDVVLEVSSVQDVNGSSQRLTLRCYKRGRVVVDEQHNVE